MDSDFQNYVVMYNCEGGAEYQSKKTGKNLNVTEVWKLKKGVKPNAPGSDMLTSFEFQDDVEVFERHSAWI